MNLIETPDIIDWPETHYVYVEKLGAFQETALAAWQELHAHINEIVPHISSHFSQYKPEAAIYRAGVGVDDAPDVLPPGLQHALAPAGKYKQFTLTGSYAQLPEACGAVFQWLEDNGIALRDDFCIEHYVNNPQSTPEEELITQILMPVANPETIVIKKAFKP